MRHFLNAEGSDDYSLIVEIQSINLFVEILSIRIGIKLYALNRVARDQNFC